MEYNKTVNLPVTEFPMKANLPQREKEILALWEKLDIYHRLLSKNKGKEKFILHDGPPYANGNIHIGHALNKILKDIIVKVKAMQGYYSPYIPGWDCHGLPIEHQLMKELKIAKHQINKVEFRQQAAAYAQRFIDIQREEFKRLGIFADWDHPYLTMNPAYEGEIIRAFKELFAAGFIYRGHKPVLWCTHCETALAEAEVEYNDHSSPSVYVEFPVVAKKLEDLTNNFEYLQFTNKYPGMLDIPLVALIWTTTPWTLPANLALAFHPKYDYVGVKYHDKILIMVKELAARTMQLVGCENYETVFELKGKNFAGLEFQHPFLARKSPVVLADFVTLEEGTGIVHIAPGHGQDDYQVGLKHKLDVYSPVDAQGRFTADVTQFAGQKVFSANEEIIKLLSSENKLFKEQKIAHSYPHCWRCKKPVIFRATEQWFLNVEHQNLRQRLLAAIKEVSWVPAFGIERIGGMLSVRPDWCLSRQRSWGTPVPIFYCAGCKKPLEDISAMEAVEKIIGAEGSDAWFVKTPEEILPVGMKCKSCGGEKFYKEEDILDVWFDSGVSHQAVLKNNSELSWPADLYLEGSDQHRGWFQTSLIPAVALAKKPPYRTVLTHGFTVDGAGRKMSKSTGNVIAPQKIIEKYGAEILRLWAASSDYQEDVRLSDEIVKGLVDNYRKIRNTLRFILGNLYDFSVEKNSLEYGQMDEIDRWILHRLQKLTETVTEAYKKFEFYKVMRSINEFCIVELSSFYLDVLKDRLYTYRADSRERRSTQTAFYQILHTLLRLIAPMLSATAEETWCFLRKIEPKLAESVFLADFPVVEEKYQSEALDHDWQKILSVRSLVNPVIEAQRQQNVLGGSLEAKIKLTPLTKKMEKFLRKYSLNNWAAILIVSQVEILPGALVSGPGQEVMINIEHAEGTKCKRCWRWDVTVGTIAEHPLICERCAKAIK
ncbi:MAG: isoleucine--tRNA ligase [Elusimicrobiota bacterium]